MPQPPVTEKNKDTNQKQFTVSPQVNRQLIFIISPIIFIFSLLRLLFEGINGFIMVGLWISSYYFIYVFFASDEEIAESDQAPGASAFTYLVRPRKSPEDAHLHKHPEMTLTMALVFALITILAYWSHARFDEKYTIILVLTSAIATVYFAGVSLNAYTNRGRKN